MTAGLGTAGTPRTADDDRRAWKAFGVASASIFLYVLDAGLMSVALPDIERAFPDSTRATVSWVSTGNVVALAGLMLIGGRLGDVYGRKRVFEWGLVILAVGALASAVAPGIGLLIAGRVVQGAGAALVTANSLSLVLSDLPPARHPFAIGMWGTSGSIAAVLGPTVGAEVLDATSWRFVVGLIGPIALLTLVAGRRPLRDIIDPDAPRNLDAAGVGLATGGIGGIVLALSQTRVWGWSDGRTIGALVIGVVALAGFVVRCHSHPEPLLRLTLLRNRSLSSAMVAAGFQQLGFFSWFFSTSFVLREIWGWSVRATGQAISLTFVCSAVTGWLGGRVASRYGYFWTTALSALVAAAGPLYWAFAFDTEPSFWSVYLPGAALFGLGGGACGILTTGIALRDVSDADHGMAYATHQTARRMASATGLGLMAALLGEASGAALLGGARNVWLMVAGAHVAMIAPLLVSREGKAPTPLRDRATGR